MECIEKKKSPPKNWNQLNVGTNDYVSESQGKHEELR